MRGTLLLIAGLLAPAVALAAPAKPAPTKPTPDKAAPAAAGPTVTACKPPEAPPARPCPGSAW
ncbi:MAG: hypothetical protein EON47_22910, partial [Acetobacteraceae bacterium]